MHILVQCSKGEKTLSTTQKKFLMIDMTELAFAFFLGRAERPIAVRCWRTDGKRELIVIALPTSFKQ